MKINTFKTGLAILNDIFPGRTFNSELMWDLLSDLKDTDFINAVKDIGKTQKELYPNTNVIALIREQIKENDPLKKYEIKGEKRYGKR